MKTQRARFFLPAVLILLVLCLPSLSTIPASSEMPAAGSLLNQPVSRINPDHGYLDTKAPLTGTWSALTSGTANNLFSVHFVSDNEGWAVGGNNTILHTTNGGSTWAAQTNQGGVPVSSYLGVRFINSSVGWAGGGSAVLRTTDGGASWVDQGAVQDGRFRNNLFAVSSTVAWMPAAGGGTRWFTRVTSGIGEEDFNVLASAAQYFDIHFTDINNGWSVGSGPIVHITNGSSATPTFSFQTSCPCPTLNGLYMLDSLTGWAVGNGGLILKTTNGGTWLAQTSGTITNLRSVHFVDANTGWAVGAGGLILMSTDGGASWTPETSGVATELRRVFFVNANVGYAVGASGTILKRTDVPATFVVNSTGDGQDSNLGDELCNDGTGDCTLRAAIQQANASAGANTINFNIAGAGVQTITPATPLPDITEAVTIDGKTQPGFSSTPIIELNGAASGGGADGLRIMAGNSIVQGLVINRFNGDGIELSGSGNNQIKCNFIGVDAAGTADLGNGLSGIYINNTPGNTIGGLVAGTRNVISGNDEYGIQIFDSGAINNTVQGNFIGTNAAGNTPVGNQINGVLIFIGSSNLIGGPTTAARNLISGNNGTGITIVGSFGATGNQIQGNFIGTDAAGTAPLGNAGHGVSLAGVPANTVGGTTAGAGNVISANGLNGVLIFASASAGNTVAGNLIGTDASGTTDLGNGFNGVEVNAAPNNFIGGTTAAARNVIAFSGGDGVYVAAGTGNAIRGNHIFSNVGLGIDLGANGVTANDLGDADSGPNNLQNFPVLTAAVKDGGNLILQGLLNSTPSSTFTVEFFANSACDASNHGEGQTPIFSTTVVTGANGAGNFLITLTSSVTAGQLITATAADAAGNTSEFSQCLIVVTSLNDFVVNSPLDAGDGNTADGICNDGVGNCTLRAAIEQANAKAGAQTISFNIHGGGAKTIAPPTPLPTITGPVTIDAKTQPGFATSPIIELTGTSLVATGNGLRISGGNSTVKGLVINRFLEHGILIETNGGNTIQCNYIGTDVTGNTDLGNTNDGIFINNVANNVIGGTSAGAGNLISGNDNSGVRISGAGASGNLIQGNFIGTNAAGTAPLENHQDGVSINGATGNTIGGTSAGARNVISGNTLNGVALSANASSNVVQGNYIGIDVNGAAMLANGISGVSIENSQSCTVGGTLTGARNVISGGDGFAAVFIQGASASGNIVRGNYLGTDPTGNVSLAGTTEGVFIAGAPNNTIGGTATGAGNLISGNASISGIRIQGSTASGNTIQGNFIGTNAAGTAALGNLIGVSISGAANNTIGGTTPEARNLISANGAAMEIGGSGATGNIVRGNYIGTDVTGTADLGNSQGVSVINAHGTVIGGSTAGARNVISGNDSWAISIESANNVVLQGNYIGTQADGISPLGNLAEGIRIVLAGADNIIGGTADGAANVIAFNSNAGLSLVSGTGNAIRANAIHSNGDLGIDLASAGVTANDTGDTDAGANNLQNFPVVNSATTNGTQVNIQGTLNSAANATFDLDFFVNSSCDGSGNGEGQTYIGSASVNTNGSGDVAFNVSFNVSVATSQVITATATDAAGNTSEFSSCSAPTAIELASFSAAAYDQGVFIEWKTGFEVDNLGFNIYRDEGGNRALVNKNLVAGSALRDGAALRAGESYAWWDGGVADCGLRIADCKNALYWLEDVDLKGTSTWHGPFAAKAVGGVPPARSNAGTISKIGSFQPEADSTRVVESAASLSPGSSAQASVQSALASQPAVKISIAREGWYRVTQAALVAAGLKPGIDPRFLQLFVDGREIPIHVSTRKDGSFDQSSAIEFYGIGLDTPSSDARTYWLVAGDKDGKRIAHWKPEGESSSAQSFTQTVERKDRTIYFSSLRNGDKENFFGAIIAGEGADQTLSLAHLAQFDSSKFETTLEVALQGVTLAHHRVLVQLNGTGVREISFDGQQQGIARFNINHSLLREGENTVRLVPLNGAGDVSLVGHIRISYQHAFSADHDALRFTASGGRRTTVAGFSSKAIRVFDVTDASNVQELIAEVSESKTGFAATIAPHDPGVRTLIALTDEKAKLPFSLEANRASSWRSPANAADFVIITPADLVGVIGPLRDLRQAERYKVALVEVADIYDEFNFGHKSPQAIKDFLVYAATNWKLAPRFVLFAGDASFDARNYLGLGYNDLVPTKLVDTNFLETASDDWFADFNNDGVSEMAVGRLPVRDAEETATVVSKLISYSQTKPFESVALVSDANDGFNFEQASAQLRPLFPSSLKVDEIRRGELDSAKAKALLLEAINRGQKLINYVGHGSANQWRGDLLTSADASALTNKDRLPVFVMMTCLNGYFHDAAANSLAESLIKAGHGGAIAVWASSGMTLPAAQVAINREFYRLLFAGNTDAITLGEATRRAKSAAGDRDTRLTWTLLGDPTMRIR
ncbi:MAG: C25 family cysteine peptidase [Acidobacteriota bacterium]